MEATLDMSTITPGQVKRALGNAPPNHPLAVMASSITTSSTYQPATIALLRHSPESYWKITPTLPPTSWCIGKVILVSRPKLFLPHCLDLHNRDTFQLHLASHTERFVLGNHIIDPSTQKGFLSGTPGVLEHTSSPPEGMT